MTAPPTTSILNDSKIMQSRSLYYHQERDILDKKPETSVFWLEGRYDMNVLELQLQNASWLAGQVGVDTSARENPVKKILQNSILSKLQNC